MSSNDLKPVDDSAHGGSHGIVPSEGFKGGVDTENAPKDVHIPPPSFRTDIGKGEKRFQSLSKHSQTELNNGTEPRNVSTHIHIFMSTL